MSNELVTLENADVPAYILNPELAKQMNEDAAAGISTGFAARIKLSAKTFVLVDGNSNETPVLPGDMVIAPDGMAYMPIIVLRAKKEIQKSFYLKAYNPNEDGQAPDCFSNDGITPDSSAPSKQSDSCATCPMNAWASGKDQNGNATKGKACSDSKILAVFVPKVGVHKLKLPPASLKNWGLYVKQLTARGIPVGNVKTLIGFDLKADYSILTFMFGGFIDEKLLPKLAEMAQSAEAEEIATDTITGQAQIAAPASKKPEPVKTVEVQADDLGLDLAPAAKPDLKVVKEEPVAVDATAGPSDAELAAELGL